MKRLGMVVVTSLIGGMIPGVGGQVAAAMMGVMMQNAEAETAVPGPAQAGQQQDMTSILPF